MHKFNVLSIDKQNVLATTTLHLGAVCFVGFNYISKYFLQCFLLLKFEFKSILSVQTYELNATLVVFDILDCY